MALGIQSAIVGEVRAWAGRVVGSEPISGWLVCDGTAYSVATRPELASLYNVIGNTYGGSTSSNFTVPNFANRSPWGESETGYYDWSTVGRSGSASLATHALAAAEMPRHYHGVTANSFTEYTHGTLNLSSTENAQHQHSTTWGLTVPLPTGFDNPRYFEVAGGGSPSGYAVALGDAHNHTFSTTSSSGSHTHTLTVGSIGSSSPHENMPPYVKALFLIKY